MSVRILGSAICAGIFALATVMHAQNAPQITSSPNINVAQGTTQPAPADTRSKASSKSKVKKAKGDKATGSRGAVSPQPAPAVGPPDPGKYL